MIRKIVFFSTASVLILLLGACSYFIDDSIQDVRVETPGAQNSECFVYVDGVKYVTHPPQKINIFKSRKPIEVDCLAPGNRRKKVYIKPKIESSAFYNAANMGAGVPFDYASGALFYYPDVIVVDFTEMSPSDSLPPAHNNPDIRKADTYKLEEFSPAMPRLNSDGAASSAKLLKRGEAYSEGTSKTESATVFSEPVVKGSDKGDLKSVIEKLAPEMNPAGEANKTPTSLFPGQ